jgi:uncharacterized protein (TIGR02246 family)
MPRVLTWAETGVKRYGGTGYFYGKAPMTEDEEAIADMVAEWMRASKAGDTEAVLRLIADDAVLTVVGREPFGKTAFAEAMKTAGNGWRMEGSHELVEVKAFGDWGYLRNRISLSLIPPDGSGKLPVRREGYSMAIVRKEKDGRWVLARDANMMPPP